MDPLDAQALGTLVGLAIVLAPVLGLVIGVALAFRRRRDE